MQQVKNKQIFLVNISFFGEILFSVQPEIVVIPMVCSIVLFPTIVLATILFLKHCNEKRRAKDRFR